MLHTGILFGDFVFYTVQCVHIYIKLEGKCFRNYCYFKSKWKGYESLLLCPIDARHRAKGVGQPAKQERSMKTILMVVVVRNIYIAQILFKLFFWFTNILADSEIQCWYLCEKMLKYHSYYISVTDKIKISLCRFCCKASLVLSPYL
jgi:hypothetical protein